MHTFLHEYLNLLRDPAHLAVEITLMVVVDGVVLGLAWPLVKKFVNHRLDLQHALLDEEHGVVHPNEPR